MLQQCILYNRKQPTPTKHHRPTVNQKTNLEAFKAPVESMAGLVYRNTAVKRCAWLNRKGAKLLQSKRPATTQAGRLLLLSPTTDVLSPLISCSAVLVFWMTFLICYLLCFSFSACQLVEHSCISSFLFFPDFLQFYMQHRQHFPNASIWNQTAHIKMYPTGRKRRWWLSLSNFTLPKLLQ